MIEGGKTPVLPREQLAALNFQLILYPLAGLLAAARVLEHVYRTVFTQGTTLGGETELMSFTEFNELIGAETKYALAERFGVE